MVLEFNINSFIDDNLSLEFPQSYCTRNNNHIKDIYNIKNGIRDIKVEIVNTCFTITKKNIFELVIECEDNTISLRYDYIANKVAIDNFLDYMSNVRICWD